MAKSYNPFKMWGSYVGATMVSITSIVGAGCRGGSFIDYKCLLTPFYDIFKIIPIAFVPIHPLIAILMFPILGFLVGWGIHSLVRALRK